ncbi:phage tail protein [Altererythrobacter aquiaggeris]|uniref:phage tail protein n=1 Tax=Aestuarierythrobacter aquiaggeris TaxID=1898396 RepID=UPI0030198F2A
MRKTVTKLGIAAFAAATFTPAPAMAGTDVYLGEIFAVPFNFCPRGSALADGKLMAISQNTALFSLLGTQFGGDGRTTFGLPDLRGKLTAENGGNIRYCIVTQGIFPPRN